jgi:hypothetical protein
MVPARRHEPKSREYVAAGTFSQVIPTVGENQLAKRTKLRRVTNLTVPRRGLLVHFGRIAAVSRSDDRDRYGGDARGGRPNTLGCAP